MPTQYERAMTALRNAHAAGDTQAAQRLAAMARQLREQPAQSQEPAQPQRSGFSDFTSGVQNAITQGATLGFGDEIAAGLSAGLGTGIDTIRRVVQPEYEAPGFGQRYNEALAYTRGELDRFRDNNPTAALVSELGGGVAAAGPATIRAGSTLAANLGRSIGVGSGMGAVAGAGAAEGGTGERLEGATIGGITGGLVGGAVPMLANTARGAYGAGRRALLGVRDPEGNADDLLAVAMSRDDNAEGVLERLRAAQETGAPAALVDVGGANVRGLAETIMNRPGPGQEIGAQFLEQRAGDAPQRISTAIRSFVADPQTYSNTMEEITGRMRTAAAPLYEAAYSIDPQALDTPGIRDLLGRIRSPDLYRQARELAQLDGYDLPTRTINVGGEEVEEIIPSMQALDYLKRAMDRRVDTLRRSGDNTAARAWDSARRSLIDQLDEINPDYAAARAVYAGDAQLRDALEAGNSFVTGGFDDDAIAAFQRLSPNEKDMFRLGVARQIQQIASNAGGGDIVRRFFGTPSRQQRIAALFDNPEDFLEFQRALDLERQFVRTGNRIAGGSPTDRRGAQQSDFDETARILDAGLGMGTPGGAVSLARSLLSSQMNAIGDQTGGALAQRLFATDPQAATFLAQRLLEGAERRAVADTRFANLLSRGTGAAANVSAQRMAGP